jgi:ABC-type phosphate transport system substrate-binding protein
MKRFSLLHGTALAALFAFAGTAAAQTQIYGGGSTLAAPEYAGAFQTYGAAIDGSVNFNYVGLGSGPSQTAFLTNNPSAFGYPAGTTVHFAASDAALSPTQISTFQSTRSATEGGLIQLPTFGTPITIALSPQIASGNGVITLTDDQICGIFSGKITTYGDPLLAGAGFPSSLATTTIHPTYRSDGSGTSFLFTNHLASSCHTAPYTAPDGTAHAANSLVTFTASTSFVTASGGSVPANFVAATGSPGVQAAILGSTPGVQIGYLSPDFTQIASVHASQSGFPAVAAVVNQNITTGASAGVGINPTVGATRAALATAPLPNNGNAANPASFDPLVPQPTAGYPIVGFTTWDLAQCYSNPAVATGIRNFLMNFYTSPTLTTSQFTNGFSPLPNNFYAVISADIFNNTNNLNLNIQNATACAGKTGR